MERGGSRRRCVTRRFFTRWLSRRDQEDGASIDESCGGRQGVTGVARGLRAPFGAPRKVVRQVVRRCAAASRRRGRCSLTSCASCALRTLRSFLLHGREKRVEGRKGTPIRESRSKRSTNRDRPTIRKSVWSSSFSKNPPALASYGEPFLLKKSSYFTRKPTFVHPPQEPPEKVNRRSFLEDQIRSVPILRLLDCKKRRYIEPLHTHQSSYKLRGLDHQ